MKKAILMVLFLSIISLFLFGCQSKNGITTDSVIESIKVSKLNSVDEIIIDDKASMIAFQNIILSAVKQPGIADMATPEFYIEIIYDKGKERSHFNLWLGEKGERSTLMNAEDTHTIYRISEEKTKVLIELLDSLIN